jgi:hypothetical protein
MRLIDCEQDNAHQASPTWHTSKQDITASVVEDSHTPQDFRVCTPQGPNTTCTPQQPNATGLQCVPYKSNATGLESAHRTTAKCHMYPTITKHHKISEHARQVSISYLWRDTDPDSDSEAVVNLGHQQITHTAVPRLETLWSQVSMGYLSKTRLWRNANITLQKEAEVDLRATDTDGGRTERMVRTSRCVAGETMTSNIWAQDVTMVDNS